VCFLLLCTLLFVVVVYVVVRTLATVTAALFLWCITECFCCSELFDYLLLFCVVMRWCALVLMLFGAIVCCLCGVVMSL